MKKLPKEIYLDLVEDLKTDGPNTVSRNNDTGIIEQTTNFGVVSINGKVEEYRLYLTFPVPRFIKCIRCRDNKLIPLEE